MPNYCLIYHYGVDLFLFWPLSRKENICSLCELCVSSEAGGNKHCLTYPHTKTGAISIAEV